MDSRSPSQARSDRYPRAPRVVTPQGLVNRKRTRGGLLVNERACMPRRGVKVRRVSAASMVVKHVDVRTDT